MALPAFFDPIVDAPKPQKLMLGVVGLVILGAVSYFLLLSPLQARLGALQTQQASLQREIVQNRAIVADLARYRREVTELGRRLDGLREKLPAERELPPLYRTLSDAAFQTGLAVALFQPKDARIRDYYSEIPIALTAEGAYEQLGEFFERIAALPRVVAVGELKVIGLGKAKNSMKADLLLATYTYRPVGSPPAPKPGAPAAKAK